MSCTCMSSIVRNCSRAQLESAVLHARLYQMRVIAGDNDTLLAVPLFQFLDDLFGKAMAPPRMEEGDK